MKAYLSVVLVLLIALMSSVPAFAQESTTCEAGYRLFEHEYLGTDPVCIPESPERIAVLDLSPLEVVLINGIEPVAMYQYGRDLIARSNPDINIDVMGMTANSLDVGSSTTVNFEALVASNPDLIIASASTITTGGLENFQAIAPTVSFAYPLDKSEYRASVEFTSAVLNTPETGAEILAQLDERLETFKQALGDRVGEVEISLVRQRETVVLFFGGSFGDHLIHEAGLVRPEQQRPYDVAYSQNENGGRIGFNVSEEDLQLLDAEYIFLWTAGQSADMEEEARQIIATLKDDPLWNILEGVKNDRLFVVGSHWQGFGIFEAQAALDDLFRYVAEADPQQVSPNPFLVTEASTTSAETVYPLTITHSMGTIEIPAQPQRIIALGISDIATVYALGLTPIAISANPYSADGEWPWLEGLYDAEQTVLVPYREPSFEALVEMNPDIILSNNLHNIADLYSNLAEIAPTTAPTAEMATGDTWQELTLSLGYMLNMQDEAQAIIDETEDQIVAMREKYPAMEGKTFSLSYLHSPDALGSINSPDDYAVRFFQSLGFVVTPTLADLVAEQTGVQAVLSLETMNLIDADLVVLAFGSADVQAGYEANPLYQQLQAVKEDRVVVVDLNMVTQLRGPNVLGIRWALTQLEPAFALFS